MKKLAVTPVFIVLACALLAGPASAAMSDADFLNLCTTGSAQQIAAATALGIFFEELGGHVDEVPFEKKSFLDFFYS